MNGLERVKKLTGFLQYTPAAIAFFFALSRWKAGNNESAILFGLIGLGLMLLSVLLNTIRKIVNNERRSMVVSAIVVFCCSLYPWINGEIYGGIILTLIGVFMICGYFLHPQNTRGTKWSSSMWQIYIPLAVGLITFVPLFFLMHVSENKKPTAAEAVGLQRKNIEKSSNPNKVSKAKTPATLSPMQKMADIMNRGLTPEQRESPTVQKLMEIIASDSFQEQVADQNPKTPHDFLQLFAAHGLTEAAEIDFDKIVAENQKRLENAYKARNPGKDPADEDDVMANRLTKSIKQRGAAGGMTIFLAQPETAEWIGFRFKDNPEAYNAWMDQVLFSVDTARGSRPTPTSESGNFVSASPAPTNDDFLNSLQEDIPASEKAAQDSFVELEDSTIPDTENNAVTRPKVDKEKVVTQLAPDPPALPTEPEFENTLKERFSSDRFDRAMDTLERYGPEEGLRRLRESDPEIARQMEQRHNRDNNEEYE